MAQSNPWSSTTAAPDGDDDDFGDFADFSGLTVQAAFPPAKVGAASGTAFQSTTAFPTVVQCATTAGSPSNEFDEWSLPSAGAPQPRYC